MISIALFSLFLILIVLNSGNAWQIAIPQSVPGRGWLKSKEALIANKGFLNVLPIHPKLHRISMKNRQNKYSSALCSTPVPYFTSPLQSKESKPLEAHPGLIRGQLENGLTYIIFQNKVPSGNFEAHLEILSGSVYELENQQGMAHLLEHVAYMGSPKRQRMSGTGSKTNAYTDFHHTVFFASCPLVSHSWKQNMLPLAFEALLDVLTTNIDEDRLEKERSAVLSEASMINKMDYRVECQILSALHSENRISKRFPIGKESLIKSWTREDVLFYHQLHYRPDNAILYVVGDVEIPSTIEHIKKTFGNLRPAIDSKKIFQESKEFPEVSMQSVNRHFPPLVHRWSCSKEAAEKFLPKELTSSVPTSEEPSTELLPTPRIFSHELLQSFSFHLFAKRPIEPVITEESHRRDLMKHICMCALQIRLNIFLREDPVFTFFDVNQINWVREGCAVFSMDISADEAKWRDAIKLSVREIRRLGTYGLTQNELERYKQSVLAEADLFAGQASQMTNEAVLNDIMAAESSGNTYMQPWQKLAATRDAVQSITLDDINAVARELCEHVSDIDPSAGVAPAAIVACVPAFGRDGKPMHISETDVKIAVLEALAEPLEPPKETYVPTTLISTQQLDAKAAAHPPNWVATSPRMNNAGVVQKKLSNGIKVNMKSLPTEPQKACLQIFIPGGRMLEDRKNPGALLLGARTMQEGGAFLDITREEVELFCIDNSVRVEITAAQGGLMFNFQTVTTPGPSGDVTGIEAAMQVAHVILTDYKFEEDAFIRANQGLHEQYDSIVRNLESASVESILDSLTKHDTRVLHPDHSQINSLTLSTVRDAIVSQFNTENIEVSICGDMSLQDMQALSLAYLGTIPAKGKHKLNELRSLAVSPLGKKKQLNVHLTDGEERAMGYLAGPCTNDLGVFADGTTLSDAIIRASGNKEVERRSHPLFGHVALLVFQEVVNRRLFSVVREDRRLTYDASFQIKSDLLVAGGWYLVSVTSSPDQVQEAISACIDTLNSLRGSMGVIGDSVLSSKQTLSSRHASELLTNNFWLDAMTGTQLDELSGKTLEYITDFDNVLKGITPTDIQLLVDVLKIDEDNMTSCVAIASQNNNNK